MPMPMPNDDESKEDYMDRCMANDVMNNEYPENKQRYAVCLSNWEKAPEEKSMTNNRETRTFSFVLDEEQRESKSPVIKGHAAVFNQRTHIPFWGFDEMVAPDAFADSIQKDDIRALFNHDVNYVLGRNRAGTLKLFEDVRGLAIEINPPDTQFARDLMELIKRGDVNQMSFAFSVISESWTRGGEEESDLRVLQQVKLYDVSCVTMPAYEGTDCAVRSYNQWKKVNTTNFKNNLLRRRLNLKLRKGGLKNG